MSMPILVGLDRVKTGDARHSALRCVFVRGSRVAGVLLAIVLLGAPSVQAENMKDVLTAAYQNNPRLLAQREALKAADEDVSRARSGYRPTVSVGADYGYKRSDTKPGVGNRDANNPYGYSVNATQPVFSGFQTRNAVAEAEANVQAGREDLRGVESAVLLEAATAYVDVYRDRQIVKLRGANLRALTRELQGARRRLAVGEATRTEVAQSRARRQRAVAALAGAQAQLQRSLAEFERVVRRQAGRLARPRLPARLPRSRSRARQIGEDQNPAVLSAVYRNIAADHTRSKIRGELLPSVNIEASHSGRYEPSRGVDQSNTTTVLGRLSIPLYQGGEVWARLRQASHRRDKTRYDIRDAKAGVVATIKSDWAQLQAAKAQLAATSEQVRANRIALKGSRAEYKQGQIRLLEVLDAQQELNESQVSRASAQRDLVEASFSLMASIGKLEAHSLKLAAAIYAPEEHLDAVRHKWFGLTINYADGRVERMHALPRKRR